MNHMFIYLLASAIVALAGLASAFSFLSAEHRATFLGSDRDGWDPIALGALVYAISFVVDMFSPVWGNVFKSIGLVLFAFGVLILLDNTLTNSLLQPKLGIFYAVLAVAAFLYGTAKTSGMFGYNAYALSVIVPYVGLATLSGTMATLSFASSAFKDRLAQDNGGFRLVLAGLALMFLAPFGALVITTVAVGALLATLGLIVLLSKEATQFVLAKPAAFVWLVLMVVFLTMVSPL